MIARQPQGTRLGSHRKLRGALAFGLIAIAIAVPAVVILQPRAAAPEEITTASAEVIRYDTLDEMTATSTAIVEGEVTSIRVVSEMKLNEQTLTTFAVTVAVKDVLRGRVGTTLEMIENGVLATPSKIGDHGFYFLLPRRDIPGLRLASSQARYRIGPDDRLFGSNPDDDLVRDLQSRSIGEFRQAVRDSVLTVERDRQSPKPIPGVISSSS